MACGEMGELLSYCRVDRKMKKTCFRELRGVKETAEE